MSKKSDIRDMKNVRSYARKFWANVKGKAAESEFFKLRDKPPEKQVAIGQGVLVFSEHITDKNWEKLKKDLNAALGNDELLMLRGVRKDHIKWVSFNQCETEADDMPMLKVRVNLASDET